MAENDPRFLADESCDYVVVRRLRSVGFDVLAVAEEFPGASDLEVLRRAVDERRLILTEDKDFGEWVFAHREETYGVILIRFPGNIRSELPNAIELLITQYAPDLVRCFTVLEPGRARIRK